MDEALPQTLSGAYGSAHRLPDGATQAITAWMLDVPTVHPRRHYILSVAPLEHAPGQETGGQAGHELLVAALDPRRSPRVTDPDSLAILMPVNVLVEFHEAQPEQVPLLAVELVRRVLDGFLLLDTYGIRGEEGRWRAAVQFLDAHFARHHRSLN